MQFRTEELLQRTESLPADEFSINHGERMFQTEAEADGFFTELKAKMLDFNAWNDKSGLSTFEQCDDNGKPDDQHLRQGSFVRINLPGTGKSDWVRIEEIQNTDNELVVTVRPTYDPTGDPPQTGKVSHFFSSKTTNNFCTYRNGKTVYIYVIGLNEQLNDDHASGLIEKARNALVGNLGYYLGVQKAEWTKFCNSFLYDGEEQAAG
jgi:hypothetical protein